MFLKFWQFPILEYYPESDADKSKWLELTCKYVQIIILINSCIPNSYFKLYAHMYPYIQNNIFVPYVNTLYPVLTFTIFHANAMRIEIRIGRAGVQRELHGFRIQFGWGRAKVGKIRQKSDAHTTTLKCSKWACGSRAGSRSREGLVGVARRSSGTLVGF